MLTVKEIPSKAQEREVTEATEEAEKQKRLEKGPI
jgi:hypothetical protein